MIIIWISDEAPCVVWPHLVPMYLQMSPTVLLYSGQWVKRRICSIFFWWITTWTLSNLRARQSL